MKTAQVGCLIAALIAAAPVQAQPPARAKEAPPAAPALFDLLTKLCIRTEGDLDRILAQPELQTWSKGPEISAKPKGVTFRRRASLVQTYAGKRSAILIAGTGELTTDRRALPLRMCSVTLQGADEAALVRAVQSWAGASPQRRGKRTIFRRHIVAGRQRPVVPGTLRELASSLTEGRLMSVDIQQSRGGLVAAYILLEFPASS